MNTFSNNYENGVFTETIKGKRCDAVISFNKIEKNKNNGILCVGENNHTEIRRNIKISNNSMAGVKAEDGAVLKIVGNTIMLNFGQGILLVESTHAHVEQNYIA